MAREGLIDLAAGDIRGPAGLIDRGCPAGDIGRTGATTGRGALKFRGPAAGDIGPGDCPEADGRAYWLRCDGFGLEGFPARQVRGTTPWCERSSRMQRAYE